MLAENAENLSWFPHGPWHTRDAGGSWRYTRWGRRWRRGPGTALKREPARGTRTAELVPRLCRLGKLLQGGRRPGQLPAEEAVDGVCPCWKRAPSHSRALKRTHGHHGLDALNRGPEHMKGPRQIEVLLRFHAPAREKCRSSTCGNQDGKAGTSQHVDQDDLDITASLARRVHRRVAGNVHSLCNGFVSDRPGVDVSVRLAGCARCGCGCRSGRRRGRHRGRGVGRRRGMDRRRGRVGN
mmetsp:Transcript_97320/g.253632  ORF Transcript_97320/g.253632 Transcript_97320/m.253632 type:complete len:239 (+) Transcript_97320:392-1108(+)